MSEKAAGCSASVAEIAVSRLEELSGRLAKSGWPARLRAEPGRAPCLHVQNPVPGCRALAEDIYAAPRQDGFWFWWSWAEPIAQTAADTAAAIICAPPSAKSSLPDPAARISSAPCPAAAAVPELLPCREDSV